MRTEKRPGIWKRTEQFFDRDWDRLDLVVMLILMAFCYVSFVQGDIVVTGNRSFLMQTNPLDFYDRCIEWTGDYGANYLPSTFWLFAIWNLPLRLLGRVPATVTTIAVGNNMWFKLLPTLVLAATAMVIKKICLQTGLGNRKARLAMFAFLTCPIVLFSQLIISQYDIFMVFFIVLGFYFYLKNDTARFILFFGLAITFKYQALLFFLVFLLLKEKRIWRILGRSILVLLPTAAEILLYIRSDGFRKSVFGFSALSYTDTGISLGGLQPVNLLLAAVIVLLVTAYIRKTSDETELFSCALFWANGISFALFGLMAFHPQWLLLITPFLILSMMQSRHAKIMLLLQDVFIVALYVLTVNHWSGNMDQQMFCYTAMNRHVTSAWALNMSDLYVYHDEPMLFTVIFAILLLFFVLSAPRFSQKDRTLVESDTVVNVRISFLVGVFAWSIPAYLCLWSAMQGNFQMTDSTISAESETITPIALTDGITVEQEFTSTADRLYDLELYFGNYGHDNAVNLTVSIAEKETGASVYEETTQINSLALGSCWYTIVPEEISVEPDTVYVLRITGEEDEQTCVAVFEQTDPEGDAKQAAVNGEQTDGSLPMKIKGRHVS